MITAYDHYDHELLPSYSIVGGELIADDHVKDWLKIACAIDEDRSRGGVVVHIW